MSLGIILLIAFFILVGVVLLIWFVVSLETTAVIKHEQQKLKEKQDKDGINKK